MIEEWRDIIGYEGLYQVSNIGRVKTMARLHREDRPYMKKERLMNPPVNSSGYPQVCLYKGKKGVIQSVHRLVATAFLERKPEDRVINHIDGNKQNNRIDNLEWCTYGHNQAHAIRTGLIVLPKGEDAYNARITNLQRLSIPTMYAEGITQRQIARIMGIAQQTVSKIVAKAKNRLLPETFPANGILVVNP
jgi:hypothetical protein